MSKNKNYRNVKLDPEFTALVVVDMENDFCKPGGKLYHPEGIDEVIPKLKSLLDRCRDAGAQIIFVQSVRYESSPEFARFGQPPFILKNTWGSALIEEAVPKDGEAVIEKNTHDCFYKTKMNNLLEQLKILPETHSVIVVGVAANICVYHAVIGFHIRHYNVIVPMDCCAGWPAGRKVLKAQMSDPAYSYNVALTQSEMINFVRS
jgi:nicotinamidase-related amidase